MDKERLHQLYAYSSDVEQALQRLKKAADHPKRTLIGLAGVPGAGKTSLANYLLWRLHDTHGKQVMCLSMDGFHYSKEALNNLPNAQDALSRRGAAWTYDQAAFITRLNVLKASYGTKDIAWPSFDHALGDPIENQTLVSKHTRVILVEGLYLLQQSNGWNQAADLFDQRWFLDTSVELATEQLAQRHMAAWGMTHEQAMARIQHNDSLNAREVSQSRHHADWLLYV